MAVVRDGAVPVLRRHGESRRLRWTADIPATMDRMAGFNVQNAMAAAMAIAHGVEPGAVARALFTFTTSFEQCPGRLNIHDSHGFRVILDHAHNPAGLAALGKVVTGLTPRHPRSIGMINIPGDRRDGNMLARDAAGAGFPPERTHRVSDEDPAAGED
ncbi:hypothetical protein [Paracoccus sp. MC1862]|uniref:hypothetical protein n=1 Tax=Paracoccus sp. MC1862 TaxID=2760307 RepID=UPI001601FDE8|nr:hypothetical protein [Paracoccus sp. MC1862]MBB1498442.1 hypothetical protein [Paracoccus sp. MC1862]QQO46695.1 hypothetical protein JGR78_17035 [Paracoccus sp. MC1862]